MSGGLQTISIKFLADATGLAAGADIAKKSLEDVSSEASSSASNWDKLSKASLIAGAAIGGALAVGIKAGLDNMAQLDDANVSLSSVLKNMPDTFGLTTDALDKQATALEGVTTFSRDQILAADQLLLKNTAVTGAIKDGILTQQQATQATLDLAQATGSTAPDAAAKFAKILSQPFSATKQLTAAGVVLTQQQTDQIAAFKKSGDTADAQRLIYGALTDKLNGTADAAGKTLPAQLNQAKEAFSNAEGELTTALIPALTTVVGWLKDVADWAQDNPAKFKVIVEVLAGLAGVLVSIGLATKVWTAAETVFNGVQAVFDFLMDANPVTLVVLAVIAIGAALVVAYEKSQTFQNVVKGVFSVIKSAIGDVSGAISDLVGTFEDVFNGIKSAYDSSGVGTVISAIGKVSGAVGSVLGHIPGLATGGSVPSTGTYWVGEKGPELLTLPGGSHVTPNHQLGNTGGGSTTVQINATGPTLADIVSATITKNTRATRNAVTAGASRAFP